MLLSFQLFCADISINDPNALFDHFDREIKARNTIQIETLFLQPSFARLTPNQRNSLFERSLFFHTDKEIALFLLTKQKILKVTRLGIHDILRLSVSKDRPDVADFVLHQITEELLYPDVDVITACKRNAEDKRNTQLADIFDDYLKSLLAFPAAVPKADATEQERDSKELLSSC
ncbi:MAG: hypothetical protein ACK4V2_00570 [Pseudomonadota bacterium]|jgi:hypothetical protein|nr:hypothetical protein [Alphaproteobacteria bacterium]